MDFNELIYQVGGILSLWFGISCFSGLIQLKESIEQTTLEIIEILKKYSNRNKIHAFEGKEIREENQEIEEIKEIKYKIKSSQENNEIIPALIDFI
jgi:hypothetical protein